MKSLSPITLREVIWKILSKIFMNRTEDKINKHLSQSQSAYRKSRSTPDVVWAHTWMAAKTQVQGIAIFITRINKSVHSIQSKRMSCSVVLLDFLYALCDWDRCLLILSSVLFMKIFDSIFQMTSRKVIGLRLFTGPCVLFGFGRGSRISIPSLVLVSFLSWILFSILAIS